MMTFYKLGYISVYLLCTFVTSAVSQNSDADAVSQASTSLNSFALNFLAETSDAVGDDMNVALSPYTIWSLLSIISEGARGNTAQEINEALRLPQNKDQFRKSYTSLTKFLLEKNVGVNLEITNAIFTPDDQKINRDFQQVARNIYGVDILPFDINHIPNAMKTINSYIAKATHNRIPNFVLERDLEDAEIFLTSALFFKGQWATPFNKSATHTDVFLNENGKALGMVDMMFQSGPYPYSIVQELNAHAVELPYGSGDRMSMIVLLPSKNTKLSTVLKRFAVTPITKLLDVLASAAQMFADEDIKVYLPKFKIESDLILNSILDKLGIKDLFNAKKADLLNLSNQYLYVSRIIQKAVIEVDEEGTVATAASGAEFEYKSPPPQFKANRPFAFFIVDKKAKSILFAGKVCNPNTIKF